MAFIQIIEFTTDDFDAVRQIDQKWEAATEGKRTTRRQIVTRDRNQPNRYRVLVFFDSYESAMKNSELPETQEFAGQYQQVTDSVAFHDLDVISDDGV
jgi:quinol monooxygenase YgiN